MIQRTIILCAFFAVLGCNTRDTKFGKQYNAVRETYGSPIIHDYMDLTTTDEDFERWQIPLQVHDTIRTGFHAGKGFYIHQDSILQEDDIFRKRIDDSTFAFVAILTYGKANKHNFTSIYYDSVDARKLKLKAIEWLNAANNQRNFTPKELTIKEADSILNAWGTSRFK